MAIARETHASLQAKIGLPPMPENEYALKKILEGSEGAIKAAELRQNLNKWLALEGIPDVSARGATPLSVIKAYCIRPYLKGWRKRINPNFDLLDDGEDDEVIPAATSAASPAASPVSKDWLETLYKQMEQTTSRLVETKLAQATLKIGQDTKDAIRELSRAEADAVSRRVLAELMPPRRIEIVRPGEGEAEIIPLGIQHEKFPLLLRLAQMRDREGYAPNIWLTGEAGSGKTRAWREVAKALGLEFECESSLDADYKIMGHKTPDGKYSETAFFRRFTQGGIILFDEIDNFSPSAALALNPATANNFCQFPHGLFQRHKDCIIVAAANTWGLGANNDYVGRTRLDAATLDRFQPKISWNLDTKMERAIAESIFGDKGLMWHDFMLRMREARQRQGLKILLTARMTYAGCEHLKNGFTWRECVDMIIAPGLSAEQRKAIGCDTPAPFASTNTSVDFNIGGMTHEIAELFYSGHRIEAIKRYREFNGCDLITAKNACEALEGRSEVA